MAKTAVGINKTSLTNLIISIRLQLCHHVGQVLVGLEQALGGLHNVPEDGGLPLAVLVIKLLLRRLQVVSQLVSPVLLEFRMKVPSMKTWVPSMTLDR